jgi:hypothetical protein
MGEESRRDSYKGRRISPRFLEAAAQALEGDAGLADHLPDLPYRSRHGALGWWWREAARRR